MKPCGMVWQTPLLEGNGRRDHVGEYGTYACMHSHFSSLYNHALYITVCAARTITAFAHEQHIGIKVGRLCGALLRDGSVHDQLP
jgi:hypothetical protein